MEQFDELLAVLFADDPDLVGQVLAQALGLLLLDLLRPERKRLDAAIAELDEYLLLVTLEAEPQPTPELTPEPVPTPMPEAEPTELPDPFADL